MTAHGAALELAGRRTVLRRALAPGLAVLACTLVAVHAPAGVRAPVVIIFLLLVPGAALVGLLNVDSFALELSLAIALSVAVSGLTAAVLVYTHLWSPTAVVLIVAAVSLAGGLRDVGLGGIAGQGATWFVGHLRTSFAVVWPWTLASLLAASVAFGGLVRRAAVGLLAVIVAATGLARRAVVGLFVVIVALAGFARRAGAASAAALVVVGRRAVVGLFAVIVAVTGFARRGVGGLSAMVVAVAGFARRAGAGLFAAFEVVGRRAVAGLFAVSVAVWALVRRAELSRRTGVALVALRESSRVVGGRLRNVSAVRPTKAVGRPVRSGRGAAPAAAEPSLQTFLLEELRRHARSDRSRRRRPPRSLAELEPHELADLLSWSSLQRYVSYRAVQQINPVLWVVDDLERRLARQKPLSGGARSDPAGRRVPRGVWITGVAEHMSVPVAWRVLEEDGRRKEWRARLALEAIDSLPRLAGVGGNRAVVTAGPAHGSLSGFRSGLEARRLPYLLRVDAVTAARELAPDEPTHSAAEAREVVRRRLIDGAASSLDPPGVEKSKLMLARGVERLVLFEVAASGDASVFWLSNIPAGTDRGRLAFLVRLARHRNLERSTIDALLLGALGTQPERGAELQRQLSDVALAHGLRTLGFPGGTREGAVEA